MPDDTPRIALQPVPQGMGIRCTCGLLIHFPYSGETVACLDCGRCWRVTVRVEPARRPGPSETKEG